MSKIGVNTQERLRSSTRRINDLQHPNGGQNLPTPQHQPTPLDLLKTRALKLIRKGNTSIPSQPAYTEKMLSEVLVEIVPVDRSDLKQALGQLVADGKLLYSNRHYLVPPSSVQASRGRSSKSSMKRDSSGHTSTSSGIFDRLTNDCPVASKVTQSQESDLVAKKPKKP